MEKKKYYIVDEDTGEVLADNLSYKDLSCTNANILKKKQVEDMLVNAQTIEDVDMKMLYQWLKISKELNKYNQVFLKGKYISIDFLNLAVNEPIIFSYMIKVINITHKFTNFIISNDRETYVRTWTDLYDVIGIKSKITQSKFKKICEKYDIIRIDKTLRTKDNNVFKSRLIVNPFLYRNGSYMGELAIGRFQDYLNKGNHISKYATKFLEIKGVLDLDEMIKL